METVGLTSDFVAQLAEQQGYPIAERVEIAARQPRRAPPPETLHPSIRRALMAKYPDGLWAHQSEAIETALSGHDVVLATSTASGKTLVFQAVAADVLLRDRGARVLALYPARALIHDQMTKWKELARSLDLRVGYIDGGVAMAEREKILQTCQILLATPDVVHAWVMGTLEKPAVRSFVSRVALLVLDEAHVYEGVFGTNMAFLTRRFAVACPAFKLIASTATIDRPAELVARLAGRMPTCFDASHEASPMPGKSILLARADGRGFDDLVALLSAIARQDRGRFLAFGDSRRMVEQLVAALQRNEAPNGEALGPENEETAEPDDDTEAKPEGQAPRGAEGRLRDAARRPRVLPYRAGYESEDRQAIQQALQQGQLAGVISTSALELGLDIGDIDLVVLLAPPPTMKSFWQRVGRAGRRARGTCLMLSDGGVAEKGLSAWLARPVEPSWLYLDNRYLQYANALCAAEEIVSLEKRGAALPAVLETLPESFRRMLENELNPREMVPADLYPLKQRAQDDPHRAFPLRSGTEQSFKVAGPFESALGELTFAQVLKEAYPGAVYHYMAKPFRVKKLARRDGRIFVTRSRCWLTTPKSQTMAFPSLERCDWLAKSARGFVAEAEMQVSERVVGFVLRRGNQREDHLYGPGSPWSQREINRFFETTGVCWCFDAPEVLLNAVGEAIVSAFCHRFGVQPADVGVGGFFAKKGPFGGLEVRGLCVYDATQGSLRLTQRLAGAFEEIAAEASRLITAQAAENADLIPVADALGLLSALAKDLVVQDLKGLSASEVPPSSNVPSSNLVEIVAAGEKAILVAQEQPIEVRVLGWRYTPAGLLYDLEPAHPNVRWSVQANTVVPLKGVTRTLRVDLMTGEEVKP